MDEVDEIDENHVESNDAFAAYVTIFLINIEINEKIKYYLSILKIFRQIIF